MKEGRKLECPEKTPEDEFQCQLFSYNMYLTSEVSSSLTVVTNSTLSATDRFVLTSVSDGSV